MQNIFLSYTHEDIGMAKKIYSDLFRYGLNVWFDIESLIPGQDWRYEINKAIKKSNYFIILLSKKSVNSIGYVQKELKIALEILDLHPKSKIYIVPVRLEDCEPIEEKLCDILWIDLFPEDKYENGIKKIIKVFNPTAFLLRSRQKELSQGDASEMIRKYGFYDYSFNPEGKGLCHKYKKKVIGGNEVIFDEVTGLMWQCNCPKEPLVLKDAKQWIKEFNNNGYAGYHNWRLPTLEEAMSLMEREQKNDDLYIDPIFYEKQERIWTSDLVKDEPLIWVVDFSGGECGYGRPDYDICIRLVYSG